MSAEECAANDGQEELRMMRVAGFFDGFDVASGLVTSLFLNPILDPQVQDTGKRLVQTLEQKRQDLMEMLDYDLGPDPETLQQFLSIMPTVIRRNPENGALVVNLEDLSDEVQKKIVEAAETSIAASGWQPFIRPEDFRRAQAIREEEEEIPLAEEEPRTEEMSEADRSKFLSSEGYDPNNDPLYNQGGGDD